MHVAEEIYSSFSEKKNTMTFIYWIILRSDVGTQTNLLYMSEKPYIFSHL